MKIIKQGVDPQTTSKSIRCRECGTELEVTRSDCQHVSNPHPMENDYYTVGCPTCRKTITFENLRWTA